MKCPDRKRILLKQAIHIKGKTITHMRVGCGKCLYCKGSIKRDLVFRMEQECHYQDEELQKFTTLTYDEIQIPKDKGLHYIHVRQYLDRCKTEWGKKFAYLCVGEYGAKFHRPHWHLLTWGIPQEIIADKWQKGYVDEGNLSTAAIKYCVNYLDKPLYDELKKDPEWLGTQETRNWSQGLGIQYIENIQWGEIRTYLMTGNLKVSTSDGAKLMLPRYYRTKLDNLYVDEARKKQLTELRLTQLEANWERMLEELHIKNTTLWEHDQELKIHQERVYRKKIPRTKDGTYQENIAYNE